MRYEWFSILVHAVRVKVDKAICFSCMHMVEIERLKK